MLIKYILRKGNKIVDYLAMWGLNHEEWKMLIKMEGKKELNIIVLNDHKKYNGMW